MDHSQPPQADSSHEASPNLGRDLKSLYASRIKVPQTVDEAMMKRIQKDWETSTSPPIRWRLWGTWSGVAAMFLVGVFWLSLPNRPGAEAPMTGSTRLDPADLDANGRIDILDAYQLARLIASVESSHQAIPIQYDLNQDGIVDQLDIDAIANAAVLLEGNSG